MSFFLAALILAFAALAVPQPATAEVYACRIGKPSYCFKYGGTRCEQTNFATNKSTACQKWTSACIDCHNEIPDCFGRTRPSSTSLTCTNCSKKWRSCMSKIDHRYWPNRQK